MATKWTDEQKKVIETRHRNLLVSAAAGSGKTAVLVERIIRMITDPEDPVDIDRLLVMTFTNAAAEEMRERVETALGKLLDEDPGNKNLERQNTLIHHAKITTIDSFCLNLLREHFHELDLDPGFRRCRGSSQNTAPSVFRSHQTHSLREFRFSHPRSCGSCRAESHRGNRSSLRSGSTCDRNLWSTPPVHECCPEYPAGMRSDLR